MECVFLGGITESRARCRTIKGLILNKKLETGNQKWVSEVESVAQSVKEFGISKGEVKKNVCGEH